MQKFVQGKRPIDGILALLGSIDGIAALSVSCFPHSLTVRATEVEPKLETQGGPRVVRLFCNPSQPVASRPIVRLGIPRTLSDGRHITQS